jgi:hypothetical protein
MSIDEATPQDWDQAIDSLASNNQIGGDHYNKGTNIEPIDYIMANGIGWCLGNVIKLVTRDKHDKIEDLTKAKHWIDLHLEKVYGVDGNGNKIPEDMLKKSL